jgi:hypothetical protein
MVSPWLIANAVVVGNPVAPVLAEAMEPRGLADDGARSFRVDARGGWPDLDDLRSLGPRLIWGDEDASRIYPSPAWGWTWVALLPVLALALRFDPRLRGLLLLAAALFTIWFLTYRWERFLVAVSLLLAVAAAAATVRVWRHGGVARGLPVAAALVGLLSFVQAGQTIARFTGGADVALGLESPRDLVERSFPITRLYREAGENLPASGTRVLLLGEMRHFRLPLPHAAPSAFNTHPVVESLIDGKAVSHANRALRDQGFTHLIVDPGWVRRSAERYPSLALFRDRPGLLSAYLETLGSPVAVRNGVALFRIPE